MQLQTIGLGLVLVLLPTASYAYVDPGILSSLYQLLYVAIFGALATLIFKPWTFIRSRFKRPDRPPKQSDPEREPADEPHRGR